MANNIPAPPSGGIVTSDPLQGQSTIPPPPSGSVVNSDPSQSNTSSNPTESSGGILSSIGETGENLAKGFVKGALSTTTGLGTIVHNVGEKIHPGLGEALIPQSGLTAEDMYSQPHGTAQHVGYGGETLSEFLLGDEALKGLSLSQRLAKAAKVTQLIEEAPRAQKALQIGAAALKQGALHGAEAGIVQGAQTAVRSGGNLQEAAGDAAKTAATAGVLGTGTSAAADVLGHLGNTAAKVENLSKTAGDAATKEEVAKSISQKINSAKDDLHQNYENGINDLTGRLNGAEVSAQQNPLADKAKELLAQPNPEEHPVVAQAKQAAGDRLDKKVSSLLESISTGEIPGENDTAAKPSGLVDQYGNSIEAEPEPKVAPPYKVQDLVNLRQTIRKLADSYEYGDVNSRVLRSLINGGESGVSPLDQTVEHLAQASGDDTAVQDYRDLRSNYRDKINLFEEPVIQKLRDGKIDDAAKDFVGVVRNGSALPAAGKIRFNTNALRGVIGDDGVKQFGQQVFGTMLRDSVENDRLNPAKFVETWNKVNDETKNDLFDMSNANNGLRQLTRDAQSAANLQHLTRAGVLVPVGAAAGHALPAVGAGIGTLLGLTVAEGGGIAKGRELLNYIANHPAAWGTYKAVGKTANSEGAAKAASALRGVASQAVSSSPQKSSSIKNVYQGVSDSLSQQ